MRGAARALGGVHATSAHLRQPPTSSPRLDAIILQDQLKREMRERQARYTGICPVRERIYAAVFDELIASVTRDASKRGSLLRRLYGEARMSIDAYRTVYETSIEFGSRKLTQAMVRKDGLAEDIEGLETEIAALTKEVKYLEEVREPPAPHPCPHPVPPTRQCIARCPYSARRPLRCCPPVAVVRVAGGP